jgi:hypothetical protein
MSCSMSQQIASSNFSPSLYRITVIAGLPMALLIMIRWVYFFVLSISPLLRCLSKGFQESPSSGGPFSRRHIERSSHVSEDRLDQTHWIYCGADLFGEDGLSNSRVPPPHDDLNEAEITNSDFRL